MSKGPRIPMHRPPNPSPAREPSPRETDLSALQDDLELACANAMMGDPPGPHLAARLSRECREVLRKSGLASAEVSVSSTRRGTFITIRLPRRDQTVREIVLRMQ